MRIVQIVIATSRRTLWFSTLHLSASVDVIEAGNLQLISTTKIYVFPPRAPTFEAGFIIKPQLSHRDTQEAVGVADARTPGRSILRGTSTG